MSFDHPEAPPQLVDLSLERTGVLELTLNAGRLHHAIEHVLERDQLLGPCTPATICDRNWPERYHDRSMERDTFVALDASSSVTQPSSCGCSANWASRSSQSTVVAPSEGFSARRATLPRARR